MGCDRTMDWIWETAHPQDEPPQDVGAHLDGCGPCQQQLQARHEVARDLRGLRAQLEEDPAIDLDGRVLAASAAAVEAQQSGRFPVRAEPLDEAEIPDDIADELADSIAEDFGEQFAAMTTGRLRTARDTGPVASPQQLPPEPAPTPAPPPAWQPPRATAQWMVAAALVLGAALVIGLSVGRMSTHVWPVPGAGVQATIATTNDAVIVSQRSRIHSVGLSAGGIEALSEGNTYLLAGPRGGPYEVVGVVNWGQVDSASIPMVDQGEIVVAVGPAGGWSRGKSLAMNDLADRDVEILGRRALSSPR